MSRNDAATAEQAEAAFYTAFENGDMDAMANIWARSSDVICVHPNGPQLLGYEEVMQSWQEILTDTGGFSLSVEVVHQFSDEQVSVRFVTETLLSEQSGSKPVTILATNAYRKTDSGWQIVLHHASPTPRTLEEAGEERSGPRDPDADITLH